MSLFLEEEKTLGVADFLELVNARFKEDEFRVQGEIGRVQSRGNYCFFSLKDGGDESVLNCFVWQNVLSTCGIKPEEGMEVIVTGTGEIYKRTGSFNFQVKAVELVGEGTLRKAFEALKQKLEGEGLFASEVKRPIPTFPRRIALVTSRHGEAINDFTTNVGRFGFKIDFCDARVEGQKAVFELLSAIHSFGKQKDKYDVLVLVRGGGSWESLQAFNNEEVARAIRASKVPVIVGVGHEGDVTIADMVSDFRASTPTGAAKKISENWTGARDEVEANWKEIVYQFQLSLTARRQILEENSRIIKVGLTAVLDYFGAAKEAVLRGLEQLRRDIKEEKEGLLERRGVIKQGFREMLMDIFKRIDHQRALIQAGDPKRQLKLGYSIVFKRGKVIKSVKDLVKGDEIDLKLGDGEREAIINN